MSEPIRKLYRVVCRGMQDTYGTAYVIAPDAETAYQTLLSDLNTRDLGFRCDRALDRVELVAEDAPFAVPRRLYV